MLLSGCVWPRWNASGLLLDAQRIVSEALGDEVPRDDFDRDLVPKIPPPMSLRACCAFGMDMTMRYVGFPLSWIPNITEPQLMGPHEYDNGMISLDSNGHWFGLEKNGLVYTCRGGFIDLAHVRDNADMTFFLAMRLLAELPGPLAIDFTTNDASVKVRVHVPDALLALYGRFTVAATIAEAIAYQHGTWHEIAQWWGYESVRGYSEQVSAFSPDDFYSNALGVKLGALAIRHKVFRSREDYNAGIDAWLKAALKQLGSVPMASGRGAMLSTNGVWWDSRFDLPDNRAVPRRTFNVANPVRPWLISDMQWPERMPQDVEAACADTTMRLLYVETHLGGEAISSFATGEWTPRQWVRDDFPYPVQGKTGVMGEQFPALIEASRHAMVPLFQPGFDKPRASCEVGDLEAALRRIAGESGGTVGVAAALLSSERGLELSASWGGDHQFATDGIAELPAVMAALHAIGSAELAPAVAAELRAAIVLGDGRVRERAPPALVDAYLRSLSVAEMSRGTTTPAAAVGLLVALANGAGLSAASRDRLLGWLQETPAGPRRIRAGLPKEVVLMHKTGVGPTTVTSDLGLVPLENGRQLALAVFVGETTASEAMRDATIAGMARAVWECWRFGR
ncbi:MAG: DUF4056 domain-containing protein [Deltaproteobacteria bacterium]|nr:DUF4056 domain-containing protein [Deltaproteobacteria bacterium]